MERSAVAAPVSYCALRLGVLFFAKDSSETANPRTAACFAQLTLNSTRGWSAFVKFAWSCLVATMKVHGCSLLLDGAQRAASNRLRRSAGAIALSEKARGLQRLRINSCTGYSVGAGLFIFFSPRCYFFCGRMELSVFTWLIF